MIRKNMTSEKTSSRVKRTSNVKSAAGSQTLRASSSESGDKPFGPKASSQQKSQSSSPNVSLVKPRKQRIRGSVVSDKEVSYTKSTTNLRVEAGTFNRGRNSMGMLGPSTTKSQRSGHFLDRRAQKIVTRKSSESSQEKEKKDKT